MAGIVTSRAVERGLRSWNKKVLRKRTLPALGAWLYDPRQGLG
ncbi:hypothetical protein [Alkalinema sp. FACHB-956]|nr:hypothetical protein [Alkalinema sp. FACHB-956]